MRAKTDFAEVWMKQISSKDFAEREAAEKKLREMGTNVLTVVKAGLKSELPEVVARCERLLPKMLEARLHEFRTAFLADKNRMQSFDHPVWLRYVKLVGDSKPSRSLFARIIYRPDWATRLDAAENDPTRASASYQAAVRELGERAAANMSVRFMIPV